MKCDESQKEKLFIKETRHIENTLFIYPNPVIEELIIDNGKVVMEEVKVCDILGKEVKRLFVNSRPLKTF